MSEQTTQRVEQLRGRLRRTVQRLTLARLAAGAVLAAGLLAALWLAAAAAESALWMAPAARTAVLSALVVGTGALAGAFLLWPLLRLAGLAADLSDEEAARRVGARYPDVSDRLINLLQLAEGRGSTAPAPMVDRAVRALSRDVQPVPFEHVEDFSGARRSARLATWPLLGVLVFLLAAPDAFLGASARLLAPGTHFERPAPFSFRVAPGAARLVRGDSLAITVRAAGRELPQALTLHVRNEGEQHVEHVRLAPDSAGVFRHTLPRVRTPLRYRASAGRVASAWYAVHVLRRPRVQGLQITLHPPAYTGRPAEALDPNVGDAAALPGTRVDVRLALGGRAAEEAVVAFDSGARDTLHIEDGAATGSFTLRRDDRYRLLLASAGGIQNDDPITYRLDALTDAAPAVALTAPESPAALGDDRRAELHFRISDDYGFARLRLYYRLAERRFGEPMDDFEAIDLPLEAPRDLDQALIYTWLLPETTALDLVPGDVVEYYVRVWDNNAVAGYQSAQTATQRLTLPSLAERYERLDAEQGQVGAQMDDLVGQQEHVREQFDALREELRRTREGGWENERQLEQLQEAQQQLERGVEEAARQMKQVSQAMQDERLTSPETQRLYQEMQEVAREINSPELMDALQALQEAMQNMDPGQMQQALQQFEFSEEQYRQRLERTVELFEQLRAQQKLEEAARRAEELARRQQRLAEATEQLQNPSSPADSAAAPQQSDAEPQASDEQASDPQTSDPQEAEQQPEAAREQAAREQERLAGEQERASGDMQALEEQLQALREEMKQLARAPRQAMQELTEQAQREQLSQQMQQNSQQLRQGRLQQAQQGQQQMQGQLQQMKERLQEMKQQMQGQQRQVNQAGLRQALSDVLTLSERQEALRRHVRGLGSESTALREHARTQQRLGEGLRVVSDSLQRLAREIPQMTRAVQQSTGNALRAMRRSTEAMAQRTPQQATDPQQASMTHLNELALLLTRLLEQLRNQQGQGGGMSAQQMAQQLQQMAGQQQQLGEQVQQMLNDRQGNRLSVNQQQRQQQRLEQMAQQQEALRQQLRQLSRESGPAGRRLLGDLDRIAGQMQETIDEMRSGRVERRTVERQRQIRTRLLDAQRSLRRQGRDPEREGRAAEDVLRRASPDALTPPEEADRLRRDLIRALESGYAPDYEELIRRYFDLLRQQSEQDRQPEQE